MEKASKVMYTIANVFTWIEAVLAIVLIVFSILDITHVVDLQLQGFATLFVAIFWLIV